MLRTVEAAGTTTIIERAIFYSDDRSGDFIKNYMEVLRDLIRREGRMIKMPLHERLGFLLTLMFRSELAIYRCCRQG